LWLIEPFDNTIDKKLKKFKSNQPLIKNFTNFIKDLKTIDDPARLGELKHGLYKNCIGRHLTKSHTLIYKTKARKITSFSIGSAQKNNNIF